MSATDTGLYYLQSRYYDPAIGRFLNADVYTSTGQGLLGCNMFAYCNNNPVIHCDASGTACAVAIGFETPILLPTDDVASGGAAGTLLVAALLITNATENERVKAEALALKKELEESYTVYFLCATDDINNTIIYVGRVKTANFDARMTYHKKRGRRLVKQIDNLSYEACRALEQAGMIYYHTINRQDAINNQIRGISATNKNLSLYMATLWDIINRDLYAGEECIPYTYLANLTEEMFLNGTP